MGKSTQQTKRYDYTRLERGNTEEGIVLVRAIYGYPGRFPGWGLKFTRILRSKFLMKWEGPQIFFEQVPPNTL